MSFPIGAANAGNFGDLLYPGISPRVAPAHYPVIHARNDTNTRNNTVNFSIDSTDDSFEYAASVITACVDRTVYAIRCTSGSGIVGSDTCGPNAVIATLTYGSSLYEFSSAVSTSTLGHSVKATAQETCSLAGTTAATCTATIGGTVDGKTSTTSSRTTTVTGADYYRFDVEITGGADKTQGVAATATFSSKGAATSLNSKAVALWALAGVMGVVSVLAM